MSSDQKTEIPKWIINHLRRYGNCCCGIDIVKKVGKEQLLNLLRVEGYNCELRIVSDNKFIKLNKRIKYPRNAYYILEIENVIRSYFI